jgi:DNA-binding CsgD family transcriptional regulator
MLVGREAEQRELDRLLESAREERSAVLVLRGEAGIGKTALLEYAQARAGDMRVLRCVGIEAEHELPFAGLHRLVRPCLGLIDRLPTPQAAALSSALGLSLDGVEDRFLVSLGALSLLAEACEESALLCCIDDAQWLDAPSAEALAFAARRLEAERIAMLFAVREGDLQRFDTPGVPELVLQALGEEDARALLTERLEHGPSAEVVDTLLENARGNPLALLELPAALTRNQLEGTEPILGPPPVRPAVEEAFRARVVALPADTRNLLLVAAADELGDLTAILDAAARIGLDGSELTVAEQEGLVRVDGSVTFRHPLVRSAVYRSASRDERRAAHEALAAAVRDPARSAWHRALVADRADESIASELEAAGVEAATRGAQATAAAAFERAAELSVNESRRGHRLVAAAQATFAAGRPDAALALVERARAFPLDPVDSLELVSICATDLGRRGSPAESEELMRRAVSDSGDLPSEAAAEFLIWSVFSSLVGRRVEYALSEARRLLPQIDGDGPLLRFTQLVVEGMSAVLEGDFARGGERLAAASVVGGGFHEPRTEVLNAFTYALRGDYPGSRRSSEASISSARQRGSLAGVVGSFPLVALGEIGEGRLAAASATISEGMDLAQRLGAENDQTGLLALQARIAAQRGQEDECRELAETAMQRSLAVGLAWVTEQARLALAELELALGNPQETLEQLEQLDQVPLPPVALLATPDLIDAALRVGQPERARAALERFEAWAPVSDAPLVKGLLARCRAVLAKDEGEAERLFEEAVREHTYDAPVFERARSQLAYGERLRRARRKIEARTQLRTALDTFEGLGNPLWAERARTELNATGEKARKRDVSTLDDLTPQELRIAQLVAGGATNRDAAAQLFVSPKTVEYHLRKVFMKLGVSSRIELARVPLGAPESPAG